MGAERPAGCICCVHYREDRYDEIGFCVKHKAFMRDTEACGEGELMEGWISCSERLPEIGAEVLISGRDGVTCEGFLTAGGYWNMDGWLEPPGYAVAWKGEKKRDSSG